MGETAICCGSVVGFFPDCDRMISNKKKSSLCFDLAAAVAVAAAATAADAAATAASAAAVACARSAPA